MPRIAGLACVLLLGCADAEVVEDQPAARPAPVRARVQLAGAEVWVVRGEQRWKLPAPRDEVLLNPSQTRWAHVEVTPEAAEVVVRTLSGRVVGRCRLAAVEAPGEVGWIDDARLAYVEPPTAGRPLAALRVHAVDGRLVAERFGRDFAWDPAHKRAAYFAQDGSAFVDGKRVWPHDGAPPRLRGPIVWAPDGSGITFIDSGRAQLVVIVEPGDAAAGELTWPLPKNALAPSLRPFWASNSKVVIGETAISPRFAVDWVREQ